MTTSPPFLLASDNASGVHPAVLRRLQAVNAAHAPGYGSDEHTRQAEQAFHAHFGDDASIFMVTTGTACNVLALQAVTQSIDAVFCSDIAHLFVDECSAPEHAIGCKLIGLPALEGKVTPDALERALAFQLDPYHRNRAKVLSLSQGTEYGTLYSLDELRALTRLAHDRGLKVHLDGARLANAAAALDAPLRALTRDAGIDVVSFGGTKNGLMMAEAVIVFDAELAGRMPALRKQGMQLASKHRFLAAQYLAYFEDDLWLHNARHANRMAARLAARLAAIPGMELSAPTQINMVFARVPPDWVAPLQRLSRCNLWLPDTSELRFVTSFDTTEASIDAFADAAGALAA